MTALGEALPDPDRPNSVPLPGPVDAMPRDMDADAAVATLAYAVIAIDSAGVVLGVADLRVLKRLAGLEPETVVRGLRIPADAGSSVSLAVLRLTAAALSDAIGGGLLEDALVGDVGGWGYTIYVDEAVPAQASPDAAQGLVAAWREPFASYATAGGSRGGDR